MDSTSYDSFFNNEDLAISCIDLSSQIEREVEENNRRLIDLFYRKVDHVKAILSSETKPVLFLASSNGKDSTTVVHIALEAQRQCIVEGIIPADHPICISTIDTGFEQLPMQIFSNFAFKKIKSFAEKKGINLLYEIAKPELLDEFSIRYVGAQSMLVNPLRSANCTDYFKLTPSRKLLGKYRSLIGNSTSVVGLVGSRVAESSRRAGNVKANRLDRSLSDTFEELKGARQSNPKKPKIIDVAPIWDLEDQDVFDLLRLFGNQLPSYFKSCGVLLEIYGNSFNETCQLNISSSDELKGGAGCKNSGRYGCSICTVNPNDATGESLIQHKRWSVLGAERILRVRDYLSRLSNSPRRAFHAKAYDPSLGGIMLQPNVLRTQDLTKIVRYLSQITADSIDDAAAFNALKQANKLHLHPGVKEIEDSDMDNVTKSEFLEMYVHACSKPLMPYFTLDHAVMLSMLWSVYGVPSLPYQPLKIFSDIMSGRGRIPYPKLNSELPASASEVSSIPIPEPYVLPLYVKEHTHSEEDALHDLYTEYRSVGELALGDSNNCGLKFGFSSTTKFECSGSVISSEGSYSLTELMIKVGSNSVNVNDFFSTISSEVYAYGEKELKRASNIDASKPFSFTVELGGLNIKKSAALINETGRQRRTRFEASPRKRVKVGGKYQAQRSALRFYKPTSTPLLDTQYSNSVSLLSSCGGKSYSRDFECYDDKGDQLRFCVDEDIFDLYFAQLDGIDRALQKYDDAYKRCRAQRKSVYSYQCESVVYELLNCSGISIHPDYQKRFRALLTRTNVFNQRGAFSFASMSQTELSKEVGINLKTMKQHRHEKAQFLVNEIRPARNKKRAALKHILRLPRDEQTQEIFKARVEVLMELINEEFNKANIASQGRVDWPSFKPAILTCLFHLKSLTSWSTFLSSACSQLERKAFKSLPLATKRDVVSFFCESVSTLQLETNLKGKGTERFACELFETLAKIKDLNRSNVSAKVASQSVGADRLSLLDGLAL